MWKENTAEHLVTAARKTSLTLQRILLDVLMKQVSSTDNVNKLRKHWMRRNLYLTSCGGFLSTYLALLLLHHQDHLNLILHYTHKEFIHFYLATFVWSHLFYQKLSSMFSQPVTAPMTRRNVYFAAENFGHCPSWVPARSTILGNYGNQPWDWETGTVWLRPFSHLVAQIIAHTVDWG